MRALVLGLAGIALAGLLIVSLRQYSLVLRRLYGRHRQPYLDLTTAAWPRIAVLIPCREEATIGPLIVALMAADYPPDQLAVIPIVNPGAGALGALVDDYASRFPGRVLPFHRARNTGGMAGALKEASQHATGSTAPIHVVFDGAYRPGRGLLKLLVAPLFDPEVGAAFGRIIPGNVSRRLAPRFLGITRAAESQIEHQGLTNRLRAPEISAPVAAVRRAALFAVGGWADQSDLPTLELGYRLAGNHWEVVYQSRAECKELVPETWSRALEENHRRGRALCRALLRSWRKTGADGLIRLARPIGGALRMTAWLATLAWSYTGDPVALGALAGLTLALYSGSGGVSTFFAVAAAAHLDGTRRRVRILPLLASAGLANSAALVRGGLSGLLFRQRAARAPVQRLGGLASPAGKEA